MQAARRGRPTGEPRPLRRARENPKQRPTNDALEIAAHRHHDVRALGHAALLQRRGRERLASRSEEGQRAIEGQRAAAAAMARRRVRVVAAGGGGAGGFRATWRRRGGGERAIPSVRHASVRKEAGGVKLRAPSTRASWPAATAAPRALRERPAENEHPQNAGQKEHPPKRGAEKRTPGQGGTNKRTPPGRAPRASTRPSML